MIYNEDTQALNRLNTMCDWQEFKGFNTKKLLKDIEPFKDD